MTDNIRPTAKFVLVQFLQKGDSKIVAPDGSSNVNTDVYVRALGPDVPQVPLIPIGSKILLRGDAKIFGFDDVNKLACVPYDVVMAVVEDELPTDADIDKIAAGQS